MQLTDLIESRTLVALLVAALGTVLLWLLRRRRRARRNTEIVVSALYVHPLKSCAGVSVQSARVTRVGLEWDRRWMVVREQSSVERSGDESDAEGGSVMQMVTAREYAHLVLIRPVVDEDAGTLTLRYPGAPDLVLPIDVESLAEQSVLVWETRVRAKIYGSDASEWISDVLNKRAPPREDGTRPEEARVNKTKRVFHLVSIVSESAHERPLSDQWNWNEAEAKQHIQSGFADGFPLLLTSSDSLAQLNRWSTSRQCRMETFRPNLVISGADAWAEDLWRLVEVEGAGPDGGNLRLWVSKPCPRCVLTTVDLERGRFHPSGEPLRSLRAHRKMLAHVPKFASECYFGQNLIPMQVGGTLRVGQRVRIIETKPTPLEFAPRWLSKQQIGSQEEKERIEQYGI